MCDLSRSPSDFPGVVMLDQLDIDPNFEPQTRARSNTWPLPRPENFIDPDQDEKPAVVPIHLHGQIGPDLAGGVPKKNSSRRNAWGNMSYADLITQAIHSSPDNRLTLAQIYEWMVQNVPYFKDKGDSNSSAGWKNSIRHNLSLHNRFMRVQNEGTGKSSWWMINPDAKPGKAARRRATSMETQKYEKKRGRVKKKVEALRNGQLTATPSPSSSISEGQDMFPESPPTVSHHGFQLSPDFRPRASSNASSCGRLSPIPAVESDMHDSEVPPLSPIPWNSELVHMYDPQPPTAATAVSSQANSSNVNPSLDRYATDHLVESLAESMKLRNTSPGVDGYRLPECVLKPLSNGRSSTTGYTINYKPQFCNSMNRIGNGGTDFNRQQPPPYHQQQHSPDANGSSSLPPLATAALQKRRSPPSHIIESGINGNSYTLTRLQTISSAGGASSQPLSPTHALDPMFSNRLQAFDDVDSMMRSNQLPVYGAHKEAKDAIIAGGTSPLLQHQLQHNTISPPAYLHHLQHNHHHLFNQSSSSGTSLSSTANHVVGHLLYNSLPQDLDFDSLQGGLECDVDQVIRHELSVDGNLDFNFDPMNASAANSSNTNGSSVNHQVPMTSTRSWVH